MKNRGLVTVLILACTTAALGAPVRYFPSYVLDDLVAGIYTSRLEAMNEPSLFQMLTNRETHSYRFLWLRSFHRPIAIRLDVGKRGDGTLTVKELNVVRVYYPGTVRLKIIVPMTVAEVSSFLSDVNHVDFWNLPTHDDREKIGVRGAQWVLEGVHAGQYHVVDRWSPREGPYRDLCLKLVDASKLVVPEIF